ncbi:MAG: polysaccharide deacetylase family protein [Planctomycetes bacterium]|nr:polysaccharide deacetylase family protein [Planctomycetota bacterium]
MSSSPVLFLMYHAILAEGDDGKSLNPQDRAYAVGIDKWRHQLDLVEKKWGAPVLPDFELEGGKSHHGEDIKVCLTFDDACKHHAEVALPELEKRGWKGAVFISTAQIGTDNMLSWEQVHELSDAGWIIGSHGKNHRFLRNLPEEELREELKSSKMEIEERLGKETDWLSLPGGRGGFKTLDLAREYGYRAVFGSVPGIYMNAGESVIPRCVVMDKNDSNFTKLIEDPWPTVAELAYKAWKREILKNILGDPVYHWLHRLIMKVRGR